MSAVYIYIYIYIYIYTFPLVFLARKEEKKTWSLEDIFALHGRYCFTRSRIMGMQRVTVSFSTSWLGSRHCSRPDYTSSFISLSPLPSLSLSLSLAGQALIDSSIISGRFRLQPYFYINFRSRGALIVFVMCLCLSRSPLLLSFTSS